MLESTLPGRTHRGKVRDTYDLGDRLLSSRPTRVSAFDVVIPRPSRAKARSDRAERLWFDRIKEVVPNHFIAVLSAENAAELVPFPSGRSTSAGSMW